MKKLICYLIVSIFFILSSIAYAFFMEIDNTSNYLVIDSSRHRLEISAGQSFGVGLDLGYEFYD